MKASDIKTVPPQDQPVSCAEVDMTCTAEETIDTENKWSDRQKEED